MTFLTNYYCFVFCRILYKDFSPHQSQLLVFPYFDKISLPPQYAQYTAHCHTKSTIVRLWSNLRTSHKAENSLEIFKLLQETQALNYFIVKLNYDLVDDLDSDPDFGDWNYLWMLLFITLFHGAKSIDQVLKLDNLHKLYLPVYYISWEYKQHPNTIFLDSSEQSQNKQNINSASPLVMAPWMMWILENKQYPNTIF